MLSLYYQSGLMALYSPSWTTTTIFTKRNICQVIGNSFITWNIISRFDTGTFKKNRRKMREEVKSVIIFVKCLYVCEALCITVFDKRNYYTVWVGFRWIWLGSVEVMQDANIWPKIKYYWVWVEWNRVGSGMDDLGWIELDWVGLSLVKLYWVE